MTKSVQVAHPATKTATQARYDFYRPHDRSAYWYTGEELDPLTGELVKLPSRTKQSFVDACDINNIIKTYQKTGMVQHINAQAAQGMYTDLPDEFDFQSSLDTVNRAQEAFESLPSKVRSRFENDPQQFVAFMADPANRKEAESLGLIDKQPAPPPPSPIPSLDPDHISGPEPKTPKNEKKP